MKKEYYIQGDPARAEEIKAAFEELGINVLDFGFADKTVVYCSIGECVQYLPYSINLMNILYSHPDYQELPLHVKSNPKFKPGTWLWHKTKGVFPLMVEDYDEKEGYLMQFTDGVKCYFGRDIIENDYRLWNFGDSKLGDILYDKAYNRIGIFENFGHHPDGGSFNDKTYCYLIIYYDIDDNEFYEKTCNDMDGYDAVPAIREQRDLLFQKMKEAGYQWDADKKELRKIIESKFKVGDKIEATIYGINRRVTIRGVDKTNRCYLGTHAECIGFSEQDQWHLAPKPHYDIANFKVGMPVLIRNYNNNQWEFTFFGRYQKDKEYPFRCADGYTHIQCIPYEGNEALLGTTDMCEERFINW